MTTKHQTTLEEKAYEQFLADEWEMLSEAARVVFNQAAGAAYADNLVHSYCFHPAEYEVALWNMRFAVAKLTARDCKLLTELWRAALAAASIGPDDETPAAGHKRTSGDLHWYYRTTSGMVEKILQEKKAAELQEKTAKREPEDLDDIPF